METLETYIVFGIYVAALQASKKRKNEHLTRRSSWKQDVRDVAEELAARGVTL